jgi:RsiW-degrading membrane proteinase PrsW (M82 family)
MDGILILSGLVLLSSAPVILAYFWVSKHHKPLTPLFFILAALAGLVSLGIAAVVQSFLPPFRGGDARTLILHIFMNIALTEEGGRFIALAALFKIWNHTGASRDTPLTPERGAALGLVAGFGFALVENLSYAAAAPQLALLRVITAAPLHGACGARIGMAAHTLRTAPGRTLYRFLSAVAIHGMYNLLVLVPSFPAPIPIALAFIALGSSLWAIRSGNAGA